MLQENTTSYLFRSYHAGRNSSVAPTGPTEENMYTVTVEKTGTSYGHFCPDFMETPIPSLDCDLAEVTLISSDVVDSSGVTSTYEIKFQKSEMPEQDLQVLLIFSFDITKNMVNIQDQVGS